MIFAYRAYRKRQQRLHEQQREQQQRAQPPAQEERSSQEPLPPPRQHPRSESQQQQVPHQKLEDQQQQALSTASSPEKKTKTCPHRTPGETSQALEKCHTCAAEKHAARVYRWKLLLLLLPGFFLASLDLTIVATALPSIASHFGKFNQLNWIVTSFTLTNTTFIPVFGQLSDTFGRHSSLQLATWLLVLGSVLSAAAPDFPVFLLGRGFQGVGCAGITNIAMLVLADSVSLKEQAINTSILQFLNGIGFSVGPVIGGYIVKSDWRYVFVLSAGMGTASSISLLFLRHNLKPGRVSLAQPPPNMTRIANLLSGLTTLDYPGILLFLFSFGLIILATAWGGSTYAWSSAPVLSTLIIGIALLALLVLYQYLLSPSHYLSRRLSNTQPLIPISLLTTKDLPLVLLLAASTGAALYSIFYFIAIYFTLVADRSASDAGVQLLYYLPGLGAGAYIAMFLCNVTPRQTFIPLFSGSIIECAGIAVVTYAVHARDDTLLRIMMPISGLGTGLRMMPMDLHLAGIYRDRLAPVYSSLRFVLPFGGTLALTVMGSIFQNKMAVFFGSPDLQSNGTASSFNLQDQAGLLQEINTLPLVEQDDLRSTAAQATMWAFVGILPLLALGVFGSVGLGNVWINKGKKAEVDVDVLGVSVNVEGSQVASEDAAGDRHASEILTGVYLWSLVKGTVKKDKKIGPSETRPAEEGHKANVSGGHDGVISAALERRDMDRAQGNEAVKVDVDRQ